MSIFCDKHQVPRKETTENGRVQDSCLSRVCCQAAAQAIACHGPDSSIHPFLPGGSTEARIGVRAGSVHRGCPDADNNEAQTL